MQARLAHARGGGDERGGGPAIGEDGDTLYVGLATADGETGAVVALDVADGQARWRTSLDDAFAPMPKAAPVLRTCTS